MPLLCPVGCHCSICKLMPAPKRMENCMVKKCGFLRLQFCTPFALLIARHNCRALPRQLSILSSCLHVGICQSENLDQFWTRLGVCLWHCCARKQNCFLVRISLGICKHVDAFCSFGWSASSGPGKNENSIHQNVAFGNSRWVHV